MIGETAFKGFCRHAEDGLPIRALFITPNKTLRIAQQLDMLNMAAARGLDTTYRMREPRQVLEINNAILYQRVAHPRLDLEVGGLEWHFIHGLEYLEALEEGAAIATNLTAMARL